MAQPRHCLTNLLHLPDDILYLFFLYCDIGSVVRLARSCRRLNLLIQQDCLWTALLQSQNRLTVIRGYKHRQCSLKEMCRLGNNWKNAVYTDTRAIHHRTKQLPWIQMDKDRVWISDRNLLKCYKPYQRHKLEQITSNSIDVTSGGADICRFRCKDHKIVCGSRSGELTVFNSDTGVMLDRIQSAHDGDVEDVDFMDDVIVTGSRDMTVKVWSFSETDNRTQCKLRHTAPMSDRVWSVAMHPCTTSFAVGTAGVNDCTAALLVCDLEKGQQMRSYGDRRGAGVLDIQYESAHVLLTCGYDTAIRMWDLRTPSSDCVRAWEDPFDETVFCVRSDGHNSIVSGTARHGLVRLWDKRCSDSVQMYYTGRGRPCFSPVYSLAYDSAHLYVALDLGINVLDFSIYKRT